MFLLKRRRQASNDPLPVHDSDLRNDQALQRVLHCLRALAKNSRPEEVMMVITQLQFGKYLRHPSYTAACQFVPRPITMPQAYRLGDFDVLIIHKEHGLITLEIKSVGANFHQLNMTEQEEDGVVLKKVIDAVKQLKLARIVLSRLVSDVVDAKIACSLVMPNISRSHMQRVLDTSSVGQVRMCPYVCVRFFCMFMSSKTIHMTIKNND